MPATESVAASERCASATSSRCRSRSIVTSSCSIRLTTGYCCSFSHAGLISGKHGRTRISAAGTSRACDSGAPGKAFSLQTGSARMFLGRNFGILLYKMARSGVLYIFERRQVPKCRGAREKLPPFPS